MTTCPRTAIWPECGPHGIRLTCTQDAGHAGECPCGEPEYIKEEE